ncbi:MAG: hypothetical protein GEU78_11585 [Actinobacteria bacterium]|nr:hypothetical protein [Actinomycetota bacterium]
MVETITPVVHGGRNRRYWISVVLHVVATTLTAAAFGGLLGGIGFLARAPWGPVGRALVVGIALLYAARELFGVRVPVPDRHRQVPEWWRTFYPPPVAATLYGIGLGVGFLTFLSFGTFVAVSVGAFLTADPARGALIVGPFGLARGLSVILAAGARDQEAASELVDRVQALAEGRAARLVNGCALLAVALVAGAGTI